MAGRPEGGAKSANLNFPALVFFLILFLPLTALAADLPALTGRVVDNAGIIDAATKAALTQKLADFEKKGSDQIVVATIPSLDGEEIEPDANRLFRAWKLGQAKETTASCFWLCRTTARCASRSATGWKAR